MLELRHYTTPEAAELIVATGVLRKGMKGRAYLTDLALTREEVENVLIVGPKKERKGLAYVIVQASYDALSILKEGINYMEFYVNGSIRNRNGFRITGWRTNY